MKKRIISLLLALAMIATMVPAAFAAGNNHKTITGSFEYAQGTVDYVYDDDYFAGSGYDYSDDLARSTCGLALAAANGDVDDYAEAGDVITGYLEACGFSNIQCNDGFLNKPTRDSSGIAIGSKKVTLNGKKYTILALGIRGAEYEAEWAANVNVGASGDHAGFAAAANDAYAYLKQYLKENNITGNIKIWTGSHSRGAITANMLAGRIDKLLYQGKQLTSSTTLTMDDMYIYCYEPPLGVDSSKLDVPYAGIYNNIQNIVNRGDIVTYVAPALMGFGRYGVDHYIPAPTDANYEALKDAAFEEYDSFGSGLYYIMDKVFVDTWHNVTVTPNGTAKNILKTTNGTAQTQIEFIEHLMPILVSEIGTRQDFVDNDQEDLMELLGCLMYVTGGDSLQEFLLDLASNISDNAATLVYDMVNNREESLGIQLENLILQSLKNVGAAEYDADQVNTMVKGLVKFLMKLASDYPDETATLVLNLLTIVSTHILEYNMCWLRVLPDGYMNDQVDARSVMPFTDVVKGDDIYDSVAYCYEHAYMVGQTSQFYPDRNLTRSQLATVIYRLAGKPQVTCLTDAYTDQPMEQYSGIVARAIAYCDEAGYVTGESSSYYGGEETVTYAEAMAALNAFYEDTTGSGVTDGGNSSTITRGEFADVVATVAG